MSKVCIDGYNIALIKGLGIATYGANRVGLAVWTSTRGSRPASSVTRAAAK